VTYAWRQMTPQVQRSLHLIVQEQARTCVQLSRITGRSVGMERKAIIQLLNRGLIRVASDGRQRTARPTQEGVALIARNE
jgi:predicted transcriptional regulator